MGFRDRMTTGIQHRPLRSVLYGVEGIGKSSFAAEFPGAFFLAAEDGTNQIDTQRIVPNDWADALTIMSEIEADKSGDIQTVNIDTVGWAVHMLNEYVCAQNGVNAISEISYGRGKGMVFGEFQNFMRWCTRLHASGRNVNLLAHASVTLFKNPEGEDYDRFNINMPSADKGIQEEIRQWADVVGFFNFDTAIVELQDGMRKTKKAQSSNARRIYLNRSAAFDAKNRFNLPDFIDLGKSANEGFGRFWSAYQAGVGTLAKPKKSKAPAKKSAPKNAAAQSVPDGPPAAPPPPQAPPPPA